MRNRDVLFGVLAAAAAFGLPSGAALAGTFSISPVRIDLSSSSATGALTVRNDEDTEVVVQADGLVWDQVDGAEQLTPTRDVLVSPAVFKLPPKGSQLVRVALRRAPDAAHELSYRLVVQEVPQPASDDFNGLKVSLRITLPVFVAPQAKAQPQIVWSARKDATDHLVVTATNSGNAHARVLKFSVAPANGASGVYDQTEAAYVLPGKSRGWTIDVPGKEKNSNAPALADARLFRLKGMTDSGEFATDVAVEP